MPPSRALQSLRLPLLQHTIDWGEGSGDDINLAEWKSNALSILTQLQEALAHNDLTRLTQDDVASIVAIAVPLASDDHLKTASTQVVASGIMVQLPTPTVDIISCVLSLHIKPWFSTTPHPLIHPISGRKLPRTAGGPSAAMDIYEDQRWKTAPGVASILIWCIQHLKSEDYEHVWYLVIPPIMTLLDDYESYYKLKGLIAASELLKHVPLDTLKRTGVDGLLISSLRTTMMHLHQPLSPEILRRSLLLLLRVIVLTTPVNSKSRFDALCALLGDDIIGGVWLYASTEWATLEASIRPLPGLLQELGIGSVRYLKPLVSQLVHLISLPSQHRVPLQLTSLEALEVLINICQPRISGWTGVIVEGLARSWVSLKDNNLNDQSHQKLRSTLCRVAFVLSKASPSVINNEYSRLLACDEPMFRGLLST